MKKSKCESYWQQRKRKDRDWRIEAARLCAAVVGKQRAQTPVTTEQKGNLLPRAFVRSCLLWFNCNVLFHL